VIPVIARGGKSPYGAFQYYCHDPKAETTERIAWIQIRNMMTDDPAKAWKVMAYTIRSADRLKRAAGYPSSGRPLEKPIFPYSLSWHPEQNPSKAEMLRAATETIAVLGLEEHEALIVAHNDRPHAHLHVICNRVHPLTGIAKNLSLSKRKLSDWARKHEREQGKIYCSQREQNFRKRKKGKVTRYVDPIIAEAWEKSTDGWEFMLLLTKQGYQMTRGRKRLVIVDPYGKTINPIRHLIGVRAREFNERMASVELASLPSAQVISREHRLKRAAVSPENDQG